MKMGEKIEGRVFSIGPQVAITKELVERIRREGEIEVDGGAIVLLDSPQYFRLAVTRFVLKKEEIPQCFGEGTLVFFA